MAEAPTNPRSPGQDALCRFLVKSGDGCLGVRPVKQTGAPASDSGGAQPRLRVAAMDVRPITGQTAPVGEGLWHQ